MIDTNELLNELPVAVYTTDAQGRITFFNEAAVKLWGYRPEIGSEWCGSWRIYTPAGELLPHDQCPMAVAIKEGRKIRGVEAVAERPDGTRVPFTPYPTPLFDEAGNVIGGLNVLVDMSDHKKGEVTAARLAAIVASSDDAIVSKTLEGIVTSWNQGASHIFGYTAEEMIGQHITRIVPPELHGEETEILARLRRGEHIGHYETVRVAKNGRKVDVSLTVSPVRDQSGHIVGASKVARDVTERKEAEKLQQLLMEELNHRVKNTLATVQAIAMQSSTHAKSQSDFVAAFNGRVQALAKAHALLTQTRMQGAEISEIVREQVQLGAHGDSRVAISGPTVMLDSQIAVHLALVLHELATNARKYGALSAARGHLTVSWEVRSAATRMLHLCWQESGGPRVTAPQSRGFGTTLIEQTLRGHDGETSIHYAHDGVTCRIALPLPLDQSDFSIPLPTPSTDATLLDSSERLSRRLKGKRVLVIEDEPLLAMDMEASLSAMECTVLGPAGSISHARRLIAGEEFDIALVDVNLSGQPADELASMLTQKNVPFAFVTGYGRRALPHAFREAVMLTKPFNQNQLVATMETLLYMARPQSDVIRLRQRIP